MPPPPSPPPSLCLKACITEKRKGWDVVIVTTLRLFSRALVVTDLAESCGVCVSGKTLREAGFGLGRVQFPVFLVQNATQTNPSLTACWMGTLMSQMPQQGRASLWPQDLTWTDPTSGYWGAKGSGPAALGVQKNADLIINLGLQLIDYLLQMRADQLISFYSNSVSFHGASFHLKRLA